MKDFHLLKRYKLCHEKLHITMISIIISQLVNLTVFRDPKKLHRQLWWVKSLLYVLRATIPLFHSLFSFPSRGCIFAFFFSLTLPHSVVLERSVSVLSKTGRNFLIEFCSCSDPLLSFIGKGSTLKLQLTHSKNIFFVADGHYKETRKKRRILTLYI